MKKLQASSCTSRSFGAAHRSRLVQLGFWTWVTLGILVPGSWSFAATPRNILLIIADDFGMDSQSLYNTDPAASLPPTPNINALAARGVRFVNAYGYPVCSPSRAAIITGRYGFRTGVTAALDNSDAQGIYTNEFTLPEILRATHRCGSVGKWHLGGTAPSPNLVGGWSHFSGSLQGGLGATASDFYVWTKVSNAVTRMNYSGYATTDNVNDALTWLGAQGTNRWFPNGDYEVVDVMLVTRLQVATRNGAHKGAK